MLLNLTRDLMCERFIAGFGRKCYTCNSMESLEVCDKHKTETVCTTGFDYCRTQSMDYKVGNTETTVFSRDCSPKARCDAIDDTLLKACKKADGKCSYKCCDKDLCNSSNAAVPVVSIFLILACVLVTLIRSVA